LVQIPLNLEPVCPGEYLDIDEYSRTMDAGFPMRPAQPLEPEIFVHLTYSIEPHAAGERDDPPARTIPMVSTVESLDQCSIDPSVREVPCKLGLDSADEVAES